jgi:hypothetical protein
VKVEEKITLEANRDGGLEHMEVKGSMFLIVSDPERARVQVKTSRSDKPANLQVRALYNAGGLLAANLLCRCWCWPRRTRISTRNCLPAMA